jgi:hypothetical protein
MVDAGVELSEVSVSLLYEVVGRKPDANLFTTEQAESADLAGQAYELTHRVEAEAVYRPRGWLALRARPGLYVTEGGVDAYLDLGGVLSFTGSRTVARVSE